jgi:A/G-specific adenine glycosylase
MHLNNNLSKKILTWYDNNKRALPWRISQKSSKNQYYRILSEFMLQQTKVKTVIPYFKNFVRKIPTLKYLSRSSEKKILKLWEGLGYYRRARHLHKTSKILVKKYKSRIPKKYEEIIKLPGIGEYTANILLALIYNQPRIGIDGNVKRIFLRIYNRSLDKPNKKRKISFPKSFSNNRNADLAEALMEFGAVICKPKSPLCSICNLKKECNYNKNKVFNLKSEKFSIKVKKYNIYCHLNKKKKQIALTKNKNLTFLRNFNMPKIELMDFTINKKKSGWTYLCNYKNNISNIKMNINLFYKFTKSKPKNFRWYSIEKTKNIFLPSFTKKIINKINKVYIN